MKTYGLVPAYNEEETIYDVVTLLKKNGIKPMVIDDFSNDRTCEMAKKAGAKVFKHKSNKGKGEAIKTGFDVIKKNRSDSHLVLIDGDMQYSPKEATKLLGPLKTGEADFVTGYRNWKDVPFFRHRIGNFVWRNIFNLFFGTRFKDTNCGFMALTKDSINKLDNISGGYTLENSLFIEALKNNLKIKQVPVTVRYRWKRNIPGGTRTVVGVLLFIIKEGIKYRLGIK